ncbi:MAG TPA: glycosyltransferase family 39 protein [Blastocatellia bacterium]|nr:glycosyltransferase family 39 protein [Blastocatellia bacterium]
MPEKTRLRFLSIKNILLMALFVRVLLFALVLAKNQRLDAFYTSDTGWYLRLAASLMEHGRFGSDDMPELIRTPGYPLMLIFGLWSGHVEIITIVLQVALSTATCYSLYLTAQQLTRDQRTSTLAALLYAIEPLSVLHSVLLLSETLFTFLIVASLYLLISACSMRSLVRFAWAGLCIALSVYVRPVAYFLPFALMLLGLIFWMISKERRLMISALLVGFVSLGLLSVWQMRNARVADYAGFSATGDFNAYFHFKAALKSKQESRPFYDCLEELGFYDREAYLNQHPEQRRWTLGERYRFMQREAISAAESDPRTAAIFYLKGLAISYGDPGAIEYLRLVDLYPKKGRLLNSVVGSGLFSTIKQLIIERPLVVLSNIIFGVLLLSYYALALGALWRKKFILRQDVLLIILTVIYLAITSGGTVGSARLRMPVMPFIVLFAAIGLMRLIDVRKHQFNLDC